MAKVSKEADRRQLSRLPVAGKSTKRMLPKSASSASASLDGVHTTGPARAGLQRTWQLVPVIGPDRKPLMPTTPWRAERWIKSGKATPFWSKGVFCVRLNVKPSGKVVQQVACGIDPGSKKEGLTVKSAAYTFLNIQADAVTWVSKAVETRRNMRHARRFRDTPYRQPRSNRARGGLPPSTRARWDWKLRLATWLSHLYPISRFVVEDIKAKTTGRRRWDRSFSPLQIGKNWFYGELRKIAVVELKQGWQTKELRDLFNLKKTANKMAEVFEAHCVDSWVLAASWTGWQSVPDNTRLLCVTPLQLRRRRLHLLQPGKGGVCVRDGGTRSLGFKRGSIVRHLKLGVVYIGGTTGGRISLHSPNDGRRLCQEAKPSDCRFLTFSSWRMWPSPFPQKINVRYCGGTR